MDINFSFATLLQSFAAALQYLPETLVISFVPCIIAFFIGTLIALCKYFNLKVIALIGDTFVLVSKGIPVILILFLCYYGIYGGADAFADRFGWGIRSKNIDPIVIATIALTINGIGYLVETMRSALLSMGRGQLEAAYSVGMSIPQALRRIVFPQIMVEAMPNLCNNLTATIKLSSMAFTISVIDMLNGALIYAHNTSYSYLEAYLASAVLYWSLSFGVERLFILAEKIMGKKSGINIGSIFPV